MVFSNEKLIHNLPKGAEISAASVALRRCENQSANILVFLDDDPTGTQSVMDVPVITNWEVETIKKTLLDKPTELFILTNTRAKHPEEAARINREVVKNIHIVCSDMGIYPIFVSRGDSTLRGHFPLETHQIAESLRDFGISVDATIFVPAFPEAGRVTISGVHYVSDGECGFIPVGESPYAKDLTFGYKNSRLADWIEEKSGGSTSAQNVKVIGLTQLRTDFEGVVSALKGLTDNEFVCFDAVDEFDLRQIALACIEAEILGKKFVYRCGPAFTRARIGQEKSQGINELDLVRMITSEKQGGGSPKGGLIVVGSYVPNTTRQLDFLIDKTELVSIELSIDQLLEHGKTYREDLAIKISEDLSQGNVVLYTPRVVKEGCDQEESLDIAIAVSTELTKLVNSVLKQVRPCFLIAKGGITSSDLATDALEMELGFVRGCLEPGIISLWEPRNGIAKGMPYVVFPGNVGEVNSLANIVNRLSHAFGANRVDR